MERNRSSKMSELDCLLEKHKQMEKRSIFKSVYQQEVAYQNNINYGNAGNVHCDTRHYIQQPGPPLLTSEIASVNTHLSNHLRKKPAIHLNPRVQVKTPIHINPKIIQNIASIENPTQTQFQQNNQSFAQSSVQKVHINPKLMTQMIYQKPEESHVLQEPNIPHIPHASLPPLFPAPPVLPAAPIPPVFFPSLIPRDSGLLPTPVPPAPNQSKVKPIKINSRHNIHDLVSIPLNRPTPPVSPNIEEKPQEQNSPVLQEESTSSNDIIEKQSSSNHVIPQEESPPCYVINSKNKLVKSDISPKKNSNYSLVSVSERKLIRVKKTSESNGLKSNSPSKRRLSSPRLKKVKVCPSEEVLESTSELLKSNRIFKLHDGGKMHWYSNLNANTLNLTNTSSSANEDRLNTDSSATYDSHRSQLTWTAPSVSVKRNRNLSSNSDEYFIAENGKKLLRLNQSKRKSNEYLNKSNSSTSSNKSYKSNASNKVKQRSLQILREKTRKNNQPCLLFQRFGYCANEANGTCPKVHDKKQVALCRNFLQGKCHLEKCPLSHNVGPEKMPTCKFFLDGCCVRDNCPYLHVKVPSKNPLCVDFLRGYCSLGDKCLNRHDNQCQEFQNTGKCRKGKLCPLIHDSHLIKRKRLRENTRRKNNELNVRKGETKPAEPQIVKRYYDEVSEDLISQKREKLLTQMKIVKNVYETQLHNFGKEKDCNIKQRKYSGAGDSDCETKQNNLCNKPRRPPIGPLPAYIPID